jgi:hypothetical protein
MGAFLQQYLRCNLVICSGLHPARLVVLAGSPSWSQARPRVPADYCPGPVVDLGTRPARLVALAGSPNCSPARPRSPADYCPGRTRSADPAMCLYHLVALVGSPNWSPARPRGPADYCPGPGDLGTRSARLVVLADSPS